MLTGVAEAMLEVLTGVAEAMLEVLTGVADGKVGWFIEVDEMGC